MIFTLNLHLQSHFCIGDEIQICVPRLFGAKCASCRQFFSEHDLVMRARSSIYHVDCFRCVACNRRLIQGDEFCLRDAGLLCRADHDVAEVTTNDEVSFGNDNDSNDTQFNAFNNNNNDTKSKLAYLLIIRDTSFWFYLYTSGDYVLKVSKDRALANQISCATLI